MIAESFLQELEHEAQATRRLLEQVPADKLDWRPHEKSMSLGQLAHHIATTPGGVAQMATFSEVPKPAFGHPEATSMEEVLRSLDESLDQARTALSGMDDAAMAEIWRVKDGDQELMAMPRAAVLRSIMLNHWYHHRGQMTVYLRLLDIHLPSVYGPTADENPLEG